MDRVSKDSRASNSGACRTFPPFTFQAVIVLQPGFSGKAMSDLSKRHNDSQIKKLTTDP
jgi:hypothetical protein